MSGICELFSSSFPEQECAAACKAERNGLEIDANSKLNLSFTYLGEKRSNIQNNYILQFTKRRQTYIATSNRPNQELLVPDFDWLITGHVTLLVVYLIRSVPDCNIIILLLLSLLNSVLTGSPEKRQLQVPKAERQFLISPPTTPPVGMLNSHFSHLIYIQCRYA